MNETIFNRIVTDDKQPVKRIITIELTPMIDDRTEVIVREQFGSVVWAKVITEPKSVVSLSVDITKEKEL